MDKIAKKKDDKKKRNVPWWFRNQGGKKKDKKAAMTKEAFDAIKQDAFNDELEKIALGYKTLAAGGALAGAAGAVVSESQSSGRRDYLGSMGAGALTGATIGAGSKAVKRLASKIMKPK